MVANRNGHFLTHLLNFENTHDAGLHSIEQINAVVIE